MMPEVMIKIHLALPSDDVQYGHRTRSPGNYSGPGYRFKLIWNSSFTGSTRTRGSGRTTQIYTKVNDTKISDDTKELYGKLL